MTNGWIDVIDRQPENNGRYLVVLKTEGNIGFDVDKTEGNIGFDVDKTEIRIMRFDCVNGWRLPVHFPEDINDRLNQTVLCWQPLPDLPKEIEEK